MPREIVIEGFTPDQILGFSHEQLDALVFTGEPLVFRAGTADILGEFRVTEACLEVELAQIEGGGEGVLPALWSLAEKYAQRRGLRRMDWIVHALNCAKPNPKLRRVLERKGFTVQKVKNGVEAFFFSYGIEKLER